MKVTFLEKKIQRKHHKHKIFVITRLRTMNFYDRVKKFLGFARDYSEPEERHNHNLDRYWSQQPIDDDIREDFNSPFHNGPGRHFNVFTDPLEMHRYFQQQMDEMMKHFNFFGESEGFASLFNFPQIEDVPLNHEGEDQMMTEPGDLRNQFLKPGFEKPSGPQQRRDADIDGQLDIRDWGSVFKGEHSMVPYQRQEVPKTKFFGKSVSSKTVRNSDGSIETHHTVRDSQGNEETRITRRVGDKEYTVTKKRDKDGKEEIIENLVNLDEKEVNTFFPQQDKNPELNDTSSWPFFDRFFK